MRILNLPILAVYLMITSQLAQAEPQSSECFGILHNDTKGMRFGGGRNEDEGICVIKKTDESKVLAVCSIGHFCRVKGLVDDCNDSGECVELTNITSVQQK